MTNAALAAAKPAKLEALMGTLVNELGAASNALLVKIGDTLGLFRSLAEDGPATASELAARTGTYERYVREWLASQAASGFVDYDPRSGKFSLSAEQAAVLADEDSTTFMLGGFHSVADVFLNEEKLTQAFKTGTGVGWGEHTNCLFCGSARFYRPGYIANLIGSWLPAMGVVDKLKQGARVADVGCGHGASTLIMADAFPNSEFIGIDAHEPSIAHAREHAGTRKNVRFEIGRAQDFTGEYDLIAVFDALHDMGDPVGAAAHIRSRLKPDGRLMLVEPMAGDRLEDNLNPVGRVFYAFSSSVCVPAAVAQGAVNALGAQAGEKRLTDVLRAAGFKHVRRAIHTPFNMVLEARG